jgi:hypothetical protein
VSRALLAALLALGCSGALEGELVSTPVSDWSFVTDGEEPVFATAGGRRFQRVALAPFVHEGALHLHVFTFLDGDDAALAEVLGGGELRMAEGGKVYPLAAVQLTGAGEIEPVLPSLVRQTLQMEATGLRWDPEPARYPGTQLRQWLLRLHSPAR